MKRTLIIITFSLIINLTFSKRFDLIAEGSQQITQKTQATTAHAGYRYPAPPQAAASDQKPQTKSPSTTHTLPILDKTPSPSNVVKLEQPETVASAAETEVTNTTSPDNHHHSPVIEAIDVACGKERMTVRITFDSIFNGVIYAKNHYTDTACQFVPPNSSLTMYQFDLLTGKCGTSFIDSGLTTGGQAYVEGILIIINEPGLQEAWDAARKIRCLWEGNLEQTVTYPLSVNMLDSKVLTFSGDTANVQMEVQNGVGPRAPPVQGLVQIGDRLTAVVTVQGDSEFDLLVKNCVATDGSQGNRILLSDGQGCAVKPKLMGGWTKEKTTSGVIAYSEISAFKFPDVMDLFLECTVSLCKGDCEECPNYLTLHVPNHDHDTGLAPITSTSVAEAVNETGTIRVKRNIKPQEESVKLQKVVYVVGPDDLPGYLTTGGNENTIVGNLKEVSPQYCTSLIGIISSISLILIMCLVFVIIYKALMRRRLDKF